MRTHLFAALVFAICLTGIVPTYSRATSIQEYSADIVSEMDAGNRVIRMSMRVYVAHQRMRTEAIQNGQIASITILLRDKKLSYQLNPREHTYMVFAFKPQKSQSVLLGNNQIQMRPLGDETKDGIPCHKFAFLDKGKVYGTMWRSIATGNPVIFQSADKKMTMHWSHFKSGPQPEALFAVPAGYRKIVMPSFGSVFSHMLPHPSLP